MIVFTRFYPFKLLLIGCSLLKRQRFLIGVLNLNAVSVTWTCVLKGRLGFIQGDITLHKQCLF